MVKRTMSLLDNRLSEYLFGTQSLVQKTNPDVHLVIPYSEPMSDAVLFVPACWQLSDRELKSCFRDLCEASLNGTYAKVRGEIIEFYEEQLKIPTEHMRERLSYLARLKLAVGLG